MVFYEGIVSVMGDYTFHLYPKLNINEDKSSKICPMSDGNGEHESHEKTPLKEKISRLP
jgi:hypothetical protein